MQERCVGGWPGDWDGRERVESGGQSNQYVLHMCIQLSKKNLINKNVKTEKVEN